ncbi:hypothetical protein FS749_002909 [Ceratobasidium sp. UAMH 11750]|nr:hypothetical protein FS749_002909 [Ceratobasidium sp. UAMH 11750]
MYCPAAPVYEPTHREHITHTNFIERKLLPTPVYKPGSTTQQQSVAFKPAGLGHILTTDRTVAT